MQLTDKEVNNLGEYIRRGGFIMADDFRTGEYLGGGDPDELAVFRYWLKRALPDRDMVPLDISHPIFHSYYDIDSLKMDPPYNRYCLSGLCFDKPFSGAAPLLVPQFWGLSDEHGRLQVIANYNNDIGDFWKYLDWGDKPLGDSSRAVRMTINYIVYA